MNISNGTSVGVIEAQLILNYNNDGPTFRKARERPDEPGELEGTKKKLLRTPAVASGKESIRRKGIYSKIYRRNYIQL